MIVPIHIMRRASAAIDSPHGVEWSLQGFGMLRYYLTKDKAWRLHVWDDHYRVDDVTMIHNHPWNLDSWVLSGALVNHRYRVSHRMWGEFGKPTHWETRILAGENARPSGHSRAVILVSEPAKFYVAGSPQNMYHQEWHEIHCTDALNGTITITFREFINLDRDHAFSYRMHDKEWVSAAPRTATPDEVSDILERAVNRLRLHGGLHGP